MPSEPLAEEQSEEDTAGKPTAGDVLREARLRQGLSEKVVADKLHITMHYVKALEENTYEKLPGAVFTKGYIKSYALLLGLEIDDLYSLYDEYNAQLQEGKAEAIRQRARKKTDRNKIWLVISLVAFVGGFTGLWLFNNLLNDEPISEPTARESNTIAPAVNQQRPTVTGVSPLPAEPLSTEVAERISTVPPAGTDLGEQAEDGADAVQSPESLAAGVEPDPQTDIVSAPASLAESEPVESIAVEPQEIVEPESQATPANVDAVVDDGPRVIEVAAEGSDVLRIVFSGESWIEVNDSGSNQIYRDLRKEGDVLEITGSAPFSILLGDAPFASMTLNDTEIDISSNMRIDNSARLTVGL